MESTLSSFCNLNAFAVLFSVLDQNMDMGLDKDEMLYMIRVVSGSDGAPSYKSAANPLLSESMITSTMKSFDV